MSVVIAMNLFSPLGLVPSSSISTPSYSGWRYVGSIEPLKNFDPLNVVENAPDNRLKFIREADLCMVAQPC